MQDSWSDFELTNAWSNTSTKSRLICLLLYYLSDYSAFMQKAEKTELNLFFFNCIQPLESDIFSAQFILNNVLMCKQQRTRCV